MNHSAAETLRQIVEGEDFSTPAGLLRTIKPEAAVIVPPGCPYSIATNVKHALIWQDLWLAKLRGEKPVRPVMGKDFPEVPAEEWAAVRQAFIAGLTEAWEIARRDPFTHGAPDDAQAVATLLKIANHGAYHLGQVQLLKRILTAKPKAEAAG